MDGMACVTGSAPWRWNDIITDLGMLLADLAHAGPDFMAPAGPSRSEHEAEPAVDH
jgi:hypothetical protein